MDKSEVISQNFEKVLSQTYMFVVALPVLFGTFFFKKKEGLIVDGIYVIFSLDFVVHMSD